MALRRQIGPLLRDATQAAMTAYQRRRDVRVELEHLAWRAADLAPLDLARRSEPSRYKWVGDLCVIRRPGNAPRCSACPFLTDSHDLSNSITSYCAAQLVRGKWRGERSRKR